MSIRHLTAHEVADRLGISVNLVYKLAAEGRIEHVRVTPRCVRFDPESLDEYISQRRGGHNSATPE